MLAALLLATSAHAAEPAHHKKAKKDQAAEKAKAAETPQERLERMRAAKRGAAADPKKAQDAADRAEAMRAKSIYVFAVEACDQPARCDAALRDEAEQRFMNACRACASDDHCEAERGAIKGGTAKRSASPCEP